MVQKRSRIHGNNQEWAPLYCIMLLALIWCEIKPWLWHVLAWTFLVIRIYLWYASTIPYGIQKRIGATSNYLIYLITAIVTIIHGIMKITENN